MSEDAGATVMPPRVVDDAALATVDALLASTVVPAGARPTDSLKTLPPKEETASIHGQTLMRTARVNFRKDAAVTGGGTPATHLADFELVHEIGRGGMGVIYAARQSSLAREIAIKRVRPEAAGASSERRFVSEALVTAELDHPNIVPIYDLVRDDSGQLLVGMKLVHGTSWEDRLHPKGADAGTIGGSLREHLEILLKVCDAIAFAHSRGILHRDLKPANVMVGRFGEVLVMDWGIALDISDEPREVAKTEHRSQAAGLGGSPAYMAPEQARAEVARLGPWTDVYQLGAILYEIVTGAPPHRGNGLREVLAVAASGAIESPDVRAPDRRIPAELVRIVTRALAADPGARYATATELQTALRDYLSHEESLRLADDAQQTLDALARPGEAPRDQRYGMYSRALARLSEALHLWPENETARRLQEESSTSWAEEALERGDLDLAQSQLEAVTKVTPNMQRRRAVVTAGIVSQRSRLRRGVAGIVVALMLFSAGRRGLESMFAEQEASRAAHTRTHEMRRSALAGFESAKQGRIADLARSRGEVEAAVGAGVPGAARLSELLAWCHAADLWFREDWAGLLEVTLSAPVLAEKSIEGLSSKLSTHPELASTYLGGRLETIPEQSRDMPGHLWQAVAEAARTGLPPEALEIACGVLEDAVGPRTDGHPLLTGRWSALRLAAMRGLALDAASGRGDEDSASRLRARHIACRLTAQPLSGESTAVTTVTSPLAAAVLGENETCVGIDRVTGRPRWRTLALARLHPGHQSLPAADGTVVVGGGGKILALDADTGNVRHRLYLDTAVIAMCPDPLDPGRLMVVKGAGDDVTTLGLILVEKGRPSELQFAPQPIHLLVDQANAAERIRRIRREAFAALGIEPEGEVDSTGLAPGDPPSIRPAVIARLREMLATDPEHRGILLKLLALQPDLPAPGRRALAERVAALDGSLPEQWAVRAVELDRQGFPDLADRLFEDAARGRFERGTNPEHAIGWITSPTLFLRKRGGEIFEKDTPRALELVEKGRWYSLYLDGDLQFYRDYSRWLTAEGRHEEAARMKERARDSADHGGVFLIQPWLLFAVDVAAVIHIFVPWLMLVLGLRLWWRSRESSRADLRASGVRTAGQRLLAFLTQPVDRLKCSFLGYSTRTERLSLVLGGIFFAISFVVVACGSALLMESAQVSLPLLLGDAGSWAMLQRVEELRSKYGPCASSERLLAEGWRQRGDASRSREYLEQLEKIEPATADASANRGVLDEGAGRIGEARASYTRAASLEGPAAAVARWNLARLDRDAAGATAALAGMEPRDRLAAELLPDRPLWARSSYEDLSWAILWYRDLRTRLWEMTLNLLDRGSLGSLVEILDMASETGAPTVLGLGGSSGLIVVFLTVLALSFLPFPVRPLLRPGDAGAAPPGSSRGVVARLLSPVRRHREGIATLAGLVLPGARDVLLGRVLPGMLKLLTWILAVSIRITASGLGIVSSLAVPVQSKGYFPGLHDSSIGLNVDHSLVRLTTQILVLLYLSEVVSLIARWRARRSTSRSARNP